MSRALHLHDDRLARVRARAVHLRDRRARERRLVERGEELLDGAAEAALDLARGPRAIGSGGQSSCSASSSSTQCDGQDVGAGREELAELDEGRPELDEELAEARGGLAVAVGGSGAAVDGGRVAPEHVAEARALEVRAEAVPRDDRRDLAEPVQILEGRAASIAGRTRL